MGGAWPDALTRPFALLRRAPPELRLVYLVKALDSYGYFALSEVFTTYFSEFGVSDVAAGTYYGAWGTAITAYGVATGFAIDAMGVRRSLVACYALQTLARLILAFTTNKTGAVVVLFTIQSLATSWGAPVMTIAIKRLVADADRVVSTRVLRQAAPNCARRAENTAAGRAHAQSPQLRDVALYRGVFHGIRQGARGRLGGHSGGGCCCCRVL